MDKKRKILLIPVAVFVLAIVYIVLFRGCSFSRDNTAQQRHSAEMIKSEIRGGVPENIVYMLYDGINSLNVYLGENGVSVLARVGHDYDIPVVADVLCPVVLEAVKTSDSSIDSITVSYYDENSNGIITDSMVDWRTHDGETGLFTVVASKTFQPNTSIGDLREYYSESAITPEPLQTSEPSVSEEELRPFQGEWKSVNSDWHLIICGETINAMYYKDYGDVVENENYKKYTFGRDSDGNLAALEYSKPKYLYSLNDGGQIVSTSVSTPGITNTYEKVSDTTVLPKIAAAKVKPAIGMSESEVYNSTWGSPKKRNKTTTARGTREQWVYDDGYIYLENGYVTAIQEK